MTNFVEILNKRKDRSLAIILGCKERECDPFMPADARSKLRKVILDQINDYHEFALDVLNSMSTESVVFNEEYFARLDEIHSKLDVLIEGRPNGGT